MCVLDTIKHRELSNGVRCHCSSSNDKVTLVFNIGTFQFRNRGTEFCNESYQAHSIVIIIMIMGFIESITNIITK